MRFDSACVLVFPVKVPILFMYVAFVLLASLLVSHLQLSGQKPLA